MSYFPPYIDGDGLHAPTYEERLEALAEGYKSIFGEDIALTEDTPDYQLLAVFARSLDDMTALLYRDLASFDPDLASGLALDLHCRLNGVTRQTGESDEALRLRRARAVSAGAPGTLDVLRDRLMDLPGMTYVKLIDNDTGSATSEGQPAHTLQVLYDGAAEQKVVEALCRYKPVGVATWGQLEGSWTDEDGQTHTVQYTHIASTFVKVQIELTALAGYPGTSVPAKLKTAVTNYINNLGTGEDLVVPTLYGLCYDAVGGDAPPFVITLLKAAPLAGTLTPTVVTTVPRKWLRVDPDDITVVVN